MNLKVALRVFWRGAVALQHVVEPVAEGAVTALEALDDGRVGDAGLYLHAVPNDRGILEHPLNILRAQACHAVDAPAVERLRKASLRARIMRHVSPAWNTWRLMISKRASSPLARLPQISVAYHSRSGSPEAQSGTSCSSASGNGLSSSPRTQGLRNEQLWVLLAYEEETSASSGGCSPRPWSSSR